MKKTIEKYFIPQVENDYQPHILQKTAVVAMSFLVLCTFALANLQALLWINSSWLIGTILPAVVVELTNNNRGDQQLGQLQRNSVLDAAAQAKAEHMVQNSYFAHFAPDGTSPWYFFDKVQYKYVHAGENLAVHFSDSDEVVEAWMDSPTHRANILNNKYTEIGVGTARGEYQGYPTVFVVQLFGAPQAIAAAPVSAPEVTLIQPSVSVAQTAPEPVLVQEQPPTSLAAAEVDDNEAIAEKTTSSTLSQTEITPERNDIPISDAIAVETNAQPTTEAFDTALAPEQITDSERLPVVLVSNTLETSQAVAGIETDVLLVSETQSVSSVAKLATQPQRLLNMVYLVTSAFVLIALVFSVFIEIRKQHPIQIAYGTGLLAVMALLLYVHLAVTSGALIA